MPKISTQALTDTRCQKAKVQRDADGTPRTSYLWDSSIRGFGLRVTAHGSKSFALKFIAPNGKQAWMALGDYTGPESLEAAKVRAREAKVQIDAGIDPRKALDRKNLPKVKDLVERYKAEHLPDVSEVWRKESGRLLDKHVLPVIGNTNLKDVGPAEVSSLLFNLKGDTPIQANRVRAVLRTMFGRAEEWGLRPLGSNPVAVVKQRAPETKRERRLNDLEIKALGRALEKSEETPHALAALRLALLAGMRRGEILALRWEWVDLEAGEIRIPKESHKTGKRTGRARVVHLCDALVATLKKLPQLVNNPFMIAGREPKSPMVNLQCVWERVRSAAGLAVIGEPKEEDPGLHDLRRTFASVAADLGLKGFAGELLGHSEHSTTDIYTRAAAERLHEAAEIIGARIEGILSGKIDPEKEAAKRQKTIEARRKKNA